MIYDKRGLVDIPTVDLLTLLFDSEHCRALDDTPLYAEASRPDVVLTKSDVRAISQQIAHWLREHYGVGSNGTSKDVIVTYSDGQSALPCLFFGVVAAGGIYSAANALLLADELARQIEDGPAKLLVCSPSTQDAAMEAAERASLSKERVIILNSTPVPCLEAVDGSATWSYSSSQPQLSWHAITDSEELQKTTVCLVYTSGTTGAPKGVTTSHANMVSEVYLPASMNRPIWDKWAADGKPFGSRTLAHLGTAHISGVQGYFVNPFFDGGIVYWMPRFDFMAFLKYNAALKITTFFSLPRVYSATLHPAVTDQFSSLRIAYSGGLHLDPRLYESHKLGGQNEDRTLLSQTWGSTETTGAATHMPPDRRDMTGSVGVLLPNMMMRLVDEHGHDVKLGEPGEAWLQGPIITQGYHRNENADKTSFKDGWYRTGDLIEIRGDLLYVLGRVKGCIDFRGQRAPVEQLELLLLQCPGVADAVVVSFEWEETHVPRALVVLKPGVEQTKAFSERIVKFVNERVPDYKHLRGGVAFIDSVPRLVTGKISRDKLQ